MKIDLSLIAARKLEFLVSQGWEVSGVSISRQNDDGSWRHGFVTDGGFVGWHRDQPDDVPLDTSQVERYAAFCAERDLGKDEQV